MKKKIIISFITVFSLFLALCFSSFAITEKFQDVIQLSYVNVYGLTVGEDYNRSITSGDDYEESKAYAIEQGVPSINRFYCRFYFKTPSVSAGTEGATANLGSSSSPFYTDYYIRARLTFKLYCDFRNGSTPDIQYIVPKIRTSSAIGDWQLDKLVTCGKSEYTDFKQDSNGGWYTECTVDISYKNTGDTIDNYSCQFAIYVKSNSYHPFYASVYTYTPYVDKFYYGDGSEPGAPIYQDYSELGGSIDDFSSSEDELLSGTEEGRAEFSDAVGSVSSAILSFKTFLLPFSSAFNYLLNPDTNTVFNFENILLLSLVLGAIGFFLNISSRIIMNSHRRQ